MESTNRTATPDLDLHQEIERLRADLRLLRGVVAALSADAASAARAGLHEATSRVREAGSSAAEVGKRTLEGASDQIAEHPYITMASAFAVGMALGIGLSRRNGQ
jgi:ElaB/YqjD/DUF883 family membrane-anchored ribosome-binding protein